MKIIPAITLITALIILCYRLYAKEQETHRRYTKALGQLSNLAKDKAQERANCIAVQDLACRLRRERDHLEDRNRYLYRRLAAEEITLIAGLPVMRGTEALTRTLEHCLN